ncbi:PREDICTED: uncharacterized protein LOC104708876 [Camelina sativa]|uniref:Uncharacterized protein LOC104708876 n=2 Tax=Camelina sativa TaxID=90675 RepID=A0ABM0TBR4_CAMSA|nr:PREDICTED: uncharacterized protein LOC104708876 [Camelina sativa]XP_010423835.1 PREDICTED: uncharacterized protein LOC104708876 [Camelina sativa]XP_010423836.1 PREDICTED: uncharacterized protein LOC104708876 [Camelina sativa]
MFTSLALSTAPLSTTIVSAATRRSQVSQPKSKKSKPENKRPTTTSTSGFSSGRTTKELTWKCVEGCGACCKLAKDFAFATPDEIFDDPDDVELYRSMIGDDGWCINYNKATRKCSIYSDRPYFCRVGPEVFKSLYGIEEKKFNKEAISCCIDTIKTIHGSDSKELDNFNRAIRSSPNSS